MSKRDGKFGGNQTSDYVPIQPIIAHYMAEMGWIFGFAPLGELLRISLQAPEIALLSSEMVDKAVWCDERINNNVFLLESARRNRGTQSQSPFLMGDAKWHEDLAEARALAACNGFSRPVQHKKPESKGRSSFLSRFLPG